MAAVMAQTVSRFGTHTLGCSTTKGTAARHEALRSCPKGQWWWPIEEGALGQAYHTGLVSTSLGKRLDDYMTPKDRAHFGSVMYWQRGVLLVLISTALQGDSGIGDKKLVAANGVH